jgi:hypothetical protein
MLYKECDFRKQEIRLVRTGLAVELSQPITFDNLTIIDKINEKEVVTIFSEAIDLSWIGIDGGFNIPRTWLARM